MTTIIAIINFIRRIFFNKDELNTKEKRRRDARKKIVMDNHFLKIIKNIESCENKLQILTVNNMIEQFSFNHKKEKDKIIELTNAVNEKMKKLNLITK
jgi:hypothetical protein